MVVFVNCLWFGRLFHSITPQWFKFSYERGIPYYAVFFFFCFSWYNFFKFYLKKIERNVQWQSPTLFEKKLGKFLRGKKKLQVNLHILLKGGVVAAYQVEEQECSELDRWACYNLSLGERYPILYTIEVLRKLSYFLTNDLPSFKRLISTTMVQGLQLSCSEPIKFHISKLSQNLKYEFKEEEEGQIIYINVIRWDTLYTSLGVHKIKDIYFDYSNNVFVKVTKSNYKNLL